MYINKNVLNTEGFLLFLSKYTIEINNCTRTKKKNVFIFDTYYKISTYVPHILYIRLLLYTQIIVPYATYCHGHIIL